MEKILEAVPNFSEGQRPEIIAAIVDALDSVPGARVLHTDPGPGANRTVITLAGDPQAVLDASFRAIAKACDLLDMRQHHGTHPRMGAVDVFPLVPVRGISLAEAAEYARQLGARCGAELGLPVYLYEAAASAPHRQNLAAIRAGEYEGLAHKMQQPDWQPDYGPQTFQPKLGAMVLGARPFLVAYNVNLQSTDLKAAKAIAARVRGSGYLSTDARTGDLVHQPGLLDSVKAIGWRIPEHPFVQVSMNLTDLSINGLYEAFTAVEAEARARGIATAGSELIGMLPEAELLTCGRKVLAKPKASPEVALPAAISFLGLHSLAPFVPQQRIIEYKMAELGLLD